MDIKNVDVFTNQPVVIDNGSGVIKAGFAGDEQPKTFFPSYIGRPKHTRVMAGSVEGDNFIGRKAEELRGLLKIHYPLEHGIVENWEEMEQIWQHLYSEELKILSEDHPVLLTEAPLNPRYHREKAAQIFFETFNVPAMFVSIQAVLSLYSTGRTSGLVLDSGDGVTHVVPIIDGYTINQGIKRIDLAGRDVTRQLQLLLRKSGYTFTTSSELEIIRNIKEKMCYISMNPIKEERTKGSIEVENYVLPDGKIIKLGCERFQAPEILFTPEIVGEEFYGVHHMVNDSIQRSDIDLRKRLYSNVILSGGTTLMKGFADRLLDEVRKNATSDIKIKIFAPPERKYSTWIGGSVLASLSTFKKMWVSAEEYAEDPYVIHRKTF